MQIRLPRPKDQEPRRKRPPIVSTADNPICALCNRQISRYHCPTCNVPYCSLACYKSPQHEGCSEKFDRDTLLDEIRSAQGKTNDEKKAMMDMLKRFEEDNADPDASDGQDDVERQELEQRLEGLDLDSLEPEELLALLSPSQQAAFESTLSDPHQIHRLVAEELETEQPWWVEEDEDAFEGEEDLVDTLTCRPALFNEAKMPKLPVGADGKLVANPSLVNNITALLLAYSYTLRTFALPSFSSLPPNSSERVPATRLLAQLVPFLVERSSITLNSLGDSISYVASRDDSILRNPLLVSLLLHDVSTILKPSPVSEAPAGSGAVSSLACHPSVALLRALSDIHDLFTSVTSPLAAGGPQASKPALVVRPSSASTLSKAQVSQATMASHKVVFYASLVAHPQSPAHTRLISDISHRAEREAHAREVELEARAEATRQGAEDQSSNLLVRDAPAVGPSNGSGQTVDSRKIVELE